MHGSLQAPERVLPTLNADGSRRRIRPQRFPGRYQSARQITAWLLIGLFVAIPFIRMNGMPLILLDVPARRFVLFGRAFLATDGVLLMLLLLAIFVAVIWLTALLGRAWCGWACPQTVYMEFVFRPIERLFEGDRNQQLRLDQRGPSLRRALKLFVFVLLSAVVGNLFLAYFVGVELLAQWITRPPAEHPAAFAVMAVTAGLVLLDFAWFREQMCTVICPYARLQSVLVDQRSLVVGYDPGRGEPRGHGKPQPGQGDCIDCGACARACPTGIDVRDGLQLECIACAQCLDACDSIMDRIGKPRGLIRYGSEQELTRGKKSPLLRPRVVVYPIVLAALIAGLLITGKSRAGDEVTILRGQGAPFVLQGELVQNQIRIKIQNRSSTEKAYAISLSGIDAARVIAPENPLRVRAESRAETTLFVLAPPRAFSNGARDVTFRVDDGAGTTREVGYRLLGPKQVAP
jgi:cytochrome c oxidase accessory protein FixG